MTEIDYKTLHLAKDQIKHVLKDTLREKDGVVYIFKAVQVEMDTDKKSILIWSLWVIQTPKGVNRVDKFKLEKKHSIRAWHCPKCGSMDTHQTKRTPGNSGRDFAIWYETFRCVNCQHDFKRTGVWSD